jgi:hypothetical protein
MIILYNIERARERERERERESKNHAKSGMVQRNNA